ncbi:uncharacterized protein OCT59_003855 [Rhizophagus irregularis]|uniref:HMG box domain-containing protein n=2 Tax=Rhizophagus irregularis TaxID=588596 RepID=U9TLI2_RHIID|nr:hypothetical protein GLOIN_2v1814345 [Rhizophagus irregularis DAOM 181602=DAOM 197198]EXX58937.1 hypothetical protein RirG_193300 [Rhizophagus irregularis DAOM 197198w]UZO12311.1 hypothetical protein OCT59_003855 [Rhizophagus irregularis]POG78064.1 hypothetical protein GLOIN_2v1814345 [Rhizophagus irregularis DAOM 181602=DAOM 197198]CAG8588632.1 2297_t:CDS:1 [Rhizophagus irregularis]GBC28258.1 hypothetical protein GLOIN_2v1814345 [Rhizophagus irregularis DAOM 181602=DAOM 197198]|eukprot:XP_025184930.1 hypothetical protein GLOIN_2v1814345 [Rhizophagus irregularis DAOM 181602=DAOM 197198]
MASQNSDNNSPTTQIITLPFPPIISAQDLIDKRSPERVTAKSPNAFFVYRKAFVNYLQICNHNLKMRDVSSMAGLSWKAASKEVKEAYKQIAREVERIIISQRQKRYKEYKNNLNNLNNLNNNAMIRSNYLGLPYHFHNSTSYIPQQLSTMPTGTWFPAIASNNSNQYQVYDITTQYNSLSSNLGDQAISVQQYDQQQQFDQQFDQEFPASQELIQQNFAPINSAIDQFTTDYFNENDYILWSPQNSEEKQQI